MGRVSRFVPKAQRVASAIALDIANQLTLFEPDELPEQPVQAMLNALAEFTRDPDQPIWRYSMINRETFLGVSDAIWDLDRPRTTMKVWHLAITHLRTDTGEITLTRDQLAERVGCRSSEISTIMQALKKLSAIRIERRKVPGVKGPGLAVYIVNPEVAWTGKLAARERAAETQPTLPGVPTGTLSLVKSDGPSLA